MIEYLDENNPEVAGWNESGDTIVIHSSAHMEQEYLPRYFDHNNMQSFVRQLNLYGFRNVSKEMTANVNGSNNSANSANSGNGILAFRNPHFVKGQKDLVRNIKRSTTGDRAQRKTRQDEALRAVSGELKGRLDDMEADVKDLHHKVDEVSSKLDLVIEMLSSAGIGTSTSMNVPMNGASPQAPPPSYAVASPRTATPSEAAIDGWLENVAGQKRNRSGQGSQKRQHKTARTRTGDDGKKVISSEGSMSSGDSDQEEKANDQPPRSIANNKHMFYDVHSGQRVSSPLDESRPDMFDAYDDLELDPETSSVLLTLNEERSMEDPEAGYRPLQFETAGGGLPTEPIPFDAEHMELPDIVLADDQRPSQSASVNVPPPDQAQQGPIRKFIGTHRNIVLAGLMVTMIVAVAVGAGLSTQARNSSPQPGSVADTMTYGPEPPFEQPEDMPEILYGEDFSEEEAGKMADTNIMVSAPPPNADGTADYGFEEDYAADYESVAPESLPESAPETLLPTKKKPVGGGGGGSEFAAPASSAADTAEYDEEADMSTPPREIDSSTSLVGTVVRRSGMPTAQPTAPPTAEPTLSVTSSRLLGTFYRYSSPTSTPAPAPHHFLKQHRFG